MKNTFALAALAAALLAPFSAQAHRGWIQPSATVLSGGEAWVGFDAAMSNAVFHADHAAMRLDGLVVTGPDGAVIQPANMMRGQYRSTFDVRLTQPGTYRVANVMKTRTATYRLNGEEKFWRGQADQFPAALPEGATDVTASDNANRIETWVTLGAPTTEVFAPTGEGLEVQPVTHPNDLVAGEEARFVLLREGRPAANMAITVARGGLRYRDNPEETTVTTDADGSFAITWPEAGMYWLNTSERTPGTAGQPGRFVQWTAIMEVLP